MLFNLFGFLATGFMLGMQHSLEPDHVAAVSTIVSENKNLRKSALIGAVWGLGHTTTLLVVGVIVLLLKLSIPTIVSKFFEFIVGGVLVYLGVVLLRNVITNKVHIHKHQHHGLEHTHFHSHKSGSGHRHLHKPFMVGLVHGLAGSAGVMLLIMASMTSVVEGLLFALFFGFGSVLGMAATGAVISLPFLFTARQAQLHRVFMSAIAGISIFLGITIMRNNWIF